MKHTINDLSRFKFPMTKEEQAILLNEIDSMKEELQGILMGKLANIMFFEGEAYIKLKTVLGVK